MNEEEEYYLDDDVDPILEADLVYIDRRSKTGLISNEQAELETRNAYEDAAERAREDDAP